MPQLVGANLFARSQYIQRIFIAWNAALANKVERHPGRSYRGWRCV
jgi:hypothetical protein